MGPHVKVSSLEDDDEGEAGGEDVPEDLCPLVGGIRVPRRVAEVVVPAKVNG